MDYKSTGGDVRSEVLTAGRDCPDSNTADKERDEAEKEECLPGTALLEIAVRKRHGDNPRHTVEIMDIAEGPETICEENQPKRNLNDDQHLSNQHRSGNAAAEHAAREKRKQTPNP